MKLERKQIGELYRSVSVVREHVNEEARTVEIAFSSEEPYKRWFGIEILDHDPSSIRLGRLKDGGAVLLDHNTGKHIGVVESVEIGADKVGRAVVRFGKSAEAEAAYQDVLDAILRHVSVGYIPHRMVLEEETETGETYRVMDWEPLEVSFVAIPADPTVGVGRTAGAVDVETVIERPEQAEPEPEPVEKRTLDIEILEDKPMPEDNDNLQNEQQRVNDLLTLAEKYEQYGARDLVTDYIRNGKTSAEFQNTLMDKITSRHSDASEAEIGMSDEEINRYSLSRAVSAAITGDWSKAGLERAASEAVAVKMGKAADGFYLPVDSFAKRTFNVGTAAEAGNLVQTSVLGNEFVDVLRNAMVLAGLGVRFLGGLTSSIAIPRKTSGASVSMVAETGNGGGSSVATAQLNMAPKRASNYVDYSKQSIIQGSIDVDMMMQADLMAAIAQIIQTQAFLGSGTGNEATGLVNTSGIGSVVGGANGAAIDWSHIVGLESACANANAEPDQFSGYAVNTKSRGKMKQVQKAANLDFIWDRDVNTPLNGYRAAVTNTMPSNGTKGTADSVCSTLLFGSDWSDLVIALFGGLDLVVDPFTLAATGQVRLTANQFIDVGVRQPASFSAMTDALTT